MKKNLRPLSSLSPLTKKTLQLEEFIAGANDPETSGSLAANGFSSANEHEKFSWEEPGVRSDVIKTFNLRLSEPIYLKLEYLSKVSKDSMHAILMNYILDRLEKDVEKYKRN